MLSTLVSLSLGAAVLGAPSTAAGTVLAYRGTMAAVKGDPVEGKKSFELEWMASAADNAATTWNWTLSEQGRGAWPWPDRFGRVTCDDQGRSADPGPALLVEHAGGKSTVGLIVPLLIAAEPLRKDLAWQQDKLDYQVIDRQSLGKTKVWRVEARNSYGVRRVILVDQDRPVVRSYRERVFIGQGQEHELHVELADESHLDAEATTAATAGFERLIKLRDELGYAPRTGRVEWNEKQLAVLKAAAPSVAALRSVKLLAPVVQAVEEDAQSQRGRAGAVASLKDKAVGRAAGSWKLRTVRGEEVTAADWTDQVTILHFWEYRDAPLEEPYGQVGFLDFLVRKRQAAGVRVYGVVVTDEAGDADTRRRAIQSANRLKAFMNLSYPLLVDDGTALKAIGDPRVAGGKLPLFVVIDKQGKIVEYNAGLYEVQRDRGLEALDRIVTQAAENRE